MKKLSCRELPNKLYVLSIESSVLDFTVYKIGMSSDVLNRIRCLSRSEDRRSLIKNQNIVNNISLLFESQEQEYLIIKELELRVHNTFQDKRYCGRLILPNGNTELFTDLAVNEVIKLV